jgi:hypothetical protein
LDTGAEANRPADLMSMSINQRQVLPGHHFGAPPLVLLAILADSLSFDPIKGQ